MKYFAAVVSIAVATGASAAVTFEAERNVITVAGYPKDAPCSLRQVYRADREHGWGKVEYDEAKDTYTVNATLLIGENDRGSTYFQIGTEANPRETLVMKGGLYVMPPFVARLNSDLKWASALRKQGKEVTWSGLTMGDPNDGSITPSLKIATAPPFAANRFCAGVLYPGKKTGYRAKLHVYNSTIEPLEGGSLRGIDSELYCELRVRNSRIRGFRKSFFYGYRGNWTQVEDTVFENCYLGPINSSYKAEHIKNCVLRDGAIGLGDWGGPMNLTLTGCTIENNQRPWAVYRGQVRLVDCTIGGSAEEGLVHDRFGHENRPEVIVLRHLIAKVTDQQGEPVPDALVMVIPEQFDPVLVPCKARTGEDGTTPERGSGKALLARDYAVKGVARQEPDRVEYSHEIIVEAEGFKEKTVRGVRAKENWQTVDIVLERDATVR